MSKSIYFSEEEGCWVQREPRDASFMALTLKIGEVVYIGPDIALKLEHKSGSDQLKLSIRSPRTTPIRRKHARKGAPGE